MLYIIIYTLLSLGIQPQKAITKYCAHLHHTVAAQKIYFPVSLVAPLPNAEQVNHPSSNHLYTKSTPNHIHHHYAPSVTLTHDTHHLFNCSHIRTTLSPLDLWTDPAGVTSLLARWTEKLAGGPQVGTSDSPHQQGSWEWVDNNNKYTIKMFYLLEIYTFSVIVYTVFVNVYTRL